MRTASSPMTLLAALACLVAGTAISSCGVAAEAAVVLPAPEVDNPKVAGAMQTAVLAGGCFWGVQGVYQHVTGVKQVLSGYAGGAKNTAEYETVSSGTTGHAESVQITFDPQQITYGQILQIFFSVAHDPTQLNRQGPDTGTQYRSNIFYTDATQKKIADAYIAQLNKGKAFPRAVVTRVDALQGFYPAEAYHQDFLIENPTYPYIVYNDLPKIKNLQKVFPAIYRVQPVKAKSGA